MPFRIVDATSANATTVQAIMKMGGNELLQINHMPAAGNGEELNVLRSRRWVQDAVKDGLDQYQPKRFQKTDCRQQHHPGTNCSPKGRTYRKRRVSCRIRGSRCAARRGPRLMESAY